MKKLRWFAVAGAALAAVLIASAVPVVADGKVKVRGKIGAATPVQEAVTVQITLYKVERDNFGNYKTPERADSLYATIQPGQAGGSGEFEAELEPEAEYEIKILVLDKDGNPNPEGAYYYDGPEMESELGEQRIKLAKDGTGRISLPLQWRKAEKARSNFAQAVPLKDGTYELLLYFNPPTTINLFES